MIRRVPTGRASVAGDFEDGFQDVRRLRQDDLFEHRGICDRRVECRDAADRGVEMFEQLIHDSRSQLGAKSARQLILVRDDNPIGVLHGRRNCVPVQRRDGAQIDDHQR